MSDNSYHIDNRLDKCNNTVSTSAISNLLEAIKKSKNTMDQSKNSQLSIYKQLFYNSEKNFNYISSRNSSGYDDHYPLVPITNNTNINDISTNNSNKILRERKIVSSGIVDSVNDENDFYWFKSGITNESTFLKSSTIDTNHITYNDEVFFTDNEDNIFSKNNTNSPIKSTILSNKKINNIPIDYSSTYNNNNNNLNKSNVIFTLKCDPKYKTELCRNYETTQKCNYGRKCQFAHGIHELKPIERHPNYKTKPCIAYHLDGICNYGKRCNFIHDEIAVYINRVPTNSKHKY